MITLVHLAQIIGALSIVAAAIGLRQAQRQRVRVQEDFYVHRYRKLMDELSLEALKGSLTAFVTVCRRSGCRGDRSAAAPSCRRWNP